MDQALHKQTATRTLDTAVVLAAGGVFEATPANSNGPGFAAPSLRVVGLSVFQRTVLTLQRAGIRHLFVLAGPQEESLRWELLEDRRVTALVRWMPVREFPPHDIRTWEALGEDIEGSCLVVEAHAVFSTRLVEHLRKEVEAGQTMLAVTHPSPTPSRPAEAADMIVLPAAVLRNADGALSAAATAHGSPLRAVMSLAAAEGRLKTVRTDPDSPFWYQDVRNAEEAAHAERRLLQTPKDAQDGFIDIYFNRKLSGILTPLFLKAGWSPNAITILSIAVGFAAAGCFAHGTYTAGVIGALLFQLAAVIDCCDGDVARLTFSESQLGAWLDLIGDNVVHMAIFAGIACAGYLQNASPLPLLLGAAAIAGNGLSLWMVTRLKRRGEPQARMDSRQAARADFMIRNVVSRDFSVAVLLFALFGALQWFLWLAAVGSHLFWMTMAWLSRSRS